MPAPPVGAPLPGAPLPAPQAVALYPPAELDRVMSPIALYPDPLLAQVLAASTYWDQIPEAAQWADQHHYLSGPALTAAMAADQVPWDPSIQALLPFPSVLGMMASSMPWTQEIGTAFLNQEPEVMDSVQRLRQSAVRYGYLRPGTVGGVIVRTGPYIEIVPARPEYIVVPYYDPRVVYVAPSPRLVVGGAIRFGSGITIGAAFGSWGWGATATHFTWNQHVVIVNNAPWQRTWVNRVTYVHPYTVTRYAPRVATVHVEDKHRLQERSAKEREADRGERRVKEEHRYR
jgi:hypothetical protein